MAKSKDRNVYRRPDGKWVNKRVGSKRASSVHDTQGDAYDAAHVMSQNQGGGEVTISGRNGQFREKNTVRGGNDPYPPKG